MVKPLKRRRNQRSVCAHFAIGAVIFFFGGSSTGGVVRRDALGTGEMRFFGQRLAKDYVGTAVLVNYFLLSLAAI